MLWFNVSLWFIFFKPVNFVQENFCSDLQYKEHVHVSVRTLTVHVYGICCNTVLNFYILHFELLVLKIPLFMSQSMLYMYVVLVVYGSLYTFYHRPKSRQLSGYNEFKV